MCYRELGRRQFTTAPMTLALTGTAVLPLDSSRAADRIVSSLAIAGTVWAVGFAIEAVADAQKEAFRKNPANHERFIRSGLWAWSRHPNYFEEIVIWSGIAVIAAPTLSGWQWVTMVSPVFVVVLLTRISGIPMLERRADKRWGDDAEYRAYRAKTSVLVPRPPR